MKLANFKQVVKRKIKYRYRARFRVKKLQTSLSQFAIKPNLSIVMPVFNVKLSFLKWAIKSIEKQIYPHWELCIADDGSTDKKLVDYLKQINHRQIKLIHLKKNGGIAHATNMAISLATGEYIAFMDHDDTLTRDALFEIVKTINETNADFIYSDEDRIRSKRRYSSPHFKPDYSPDLLYSFNYITHLVCVKKSLLNKVGAFDSDCDGAQDYDMILRLTEQASLIHHITKVLYHWRLTETSYSNNPASQAHAEASGKKALQKALERNAINASVLNTPRTYCYRVNYHILGNPLVSIIIPFCDKPELLTQCIKSVIEKSTYPNYEILLVSNNSIQTETHDLIKQLTTSHSFVRCITYNIPFNYSQINNYAVTHAEGEYLLLLNNDTEVINHDWIEAMLEHAQRQEIGCVGAKLFYKNDTIQHGGVILGVSGIAGHAHHFIDRHADGYYGRLVATQNFSAVTAACLMIKKETYIKVDGLDEQNLPVAFNDVDFCLRVAEKGYRNLWTPYATLYHYESLSRGDDDTPAKRRRAQGEALHMRSKWCNQIQRDPYYNQNLSHKRENFGLHCR